MAETLKNLGQVTPSVYVLTPLYTVPVNRSSVISSFSACNRSPISPLKFRLSHAVAGAADDLKQYVYYDESIPPGKTFVATLGITMAASDALRVMANHPDATFQAWGSEVS